MTADKPRILLTNDDGYDAAGLAALVEALSPLGELVVVAPDREQSAAAHALTVARPLRVREVEPARYRVDGTPTDCVHLGVERLCGGRSPDLVVSGINRGLNIGDDLTYSGTVAGALEGALLGFPAIALSAAIEKNGQAEYGPAAAFAPALCRKVLGRRLSRGTLLNVNFPKGRPVGVRVTRQGTRTYRATSEERLDPAGRPYYWIAAADITPAEEADGDHVAIRDGFVSITPLHANLTHEASLEGLLSWDWELT